MTFRTLPPGVDRRDRIDSLLIRVRGMVAYGDSKEQIASRLCMDYTQGEIFNAYVAAKILEADRA